MTTRRLRRVCSGLLALLVVGGARAVSGAPLLVANNGLDGPATCGSKGAPCRSISQAIANAQEGDTILVGPGRYGDLNGDGAFDDPGDEAAEVDTGCDCMIHVDKPVTILSRDGAGATILDAGSASVFVVRIDAGGASLGEVGKGFTVLGSGDSSGIVALSSAAEIVIAGNRMIGLAGTGLSLLGRGNTALANDSIGNAGFGFFFRLEGGGNSIAGNEAILNGSGFELRGARDDLVVGNAALRNEVDGFRLLEVSCTFIGDVAAGNLGHGFSLTANSRGVVILGSVAAGNGRGINVTGDSLVVSRSSVVGNYGVGVAVHAAATGIEIEQSNLFGNNGGADLGLTNCGLLNASAAPVLAGGNFWGLPNGGVGSDPGDRPCDAAGGFLPTATFSPAARKEIKVRPRVAQ